MDIQNRDNEALPAGGRGSRKQTNINDDVQHALSSPGGVTPGKLMEILNADLPADRQVEVREVRGANGAAVEAPLSKVYTEFDQGKDVVITEQITTTGLFPGSVGSIANNAFYSSSNESAAAKNYYITAADGTTTSSNSLFDIV
jgi:hypothetical protein